MDVKQKSEKSLTTKVGEHILSVFSMFTISSFTDITIKHDVYREKDYLKKFCERLKKHARRIIN